MNKVSRFLYPGVRLKRWIFLFILSFIVFSIGLSGIMGKVLGGVKINFLNLDKYFIPLRDFIIDSTRRVTIDIIVIIIGIIGVYYTVSIFLKTLHTLYPLKIDIVKASYDEIRLRKGTKIVTIGGGTGLSSLLKGLKLYTSNISAIVTVADDGGSSGRLRKDLKMLPPGDIRNCMTALADSSTLMSKIFQHRFKTNNDLNGHSFGNLFIAAISKISGSFEKAIEESSKILSIRGKVYPVTLEKIILKAKLKNKKTIKGQSNISNSKYPIERVFINPVSPLPSNKAIISIKKAKVIVLGPGSLYTSIIPNLLVKDITKEILHSKAKKIYVCNIMTQPGETSNYKLSDHIKAIIDHTGYNIIQYVIVNIEKIPAILLNRYKKENSYPVKIDEKNLKKYDIILIKEKFLSIENNLIRHNSEKLAKVILKISI
ncbi:MAG: YvcK family protein [Candidatus Firestonebacteria bacterium]